ncbi:DUF4292 domain-containing protein [bacterium]|nr:DUF4292 domain-containing protein [bacterium]
MLRNYVIKLKESLRTFVNLFLLFLLLIIGTHSAGAEINNDGDLHIKETSTRILKKIKTKDAYIRTAYISGKVKYSLPFDKKLKLYKTYKIQRDSNIHIKIYILLRLKVADFVSNTNLVKYKRIRKRVKIRNTSEFNLNIFNKHLDFDLTIQELNNLLLGLSLVELGNGEYSSKIIDDQLIIDQDDIQTSIDIKTAEITNISINSKRRVAEIVFSEFVPIYNNKLIDTKTNKHPLITLENGRILRLPRKITLVTPNFTMKIYHENDIVVNNKINQKEFLINK